MYVAAADLLSNSSSDSNKYKRAWIKARLIFSSILSAGEYPDVCSRELSIALNHREIALAYFFGKLAEVTAIMDAISL